MTSKLAILFILALSLPCYGQILAPILQGAPAAGGGIPNIVHAVAAPEISCWSGAPCALTIPATSLGNTLVTYMEDSVVGTAGTVTASGASFLHKCNALHVPTGSEVSTVTVDLAFNIPAGITTINYGGSGASNMHFYVAEVSGLIAGDPADGCNATANGNSHANPQSANSVTTTHANDFVLGFFSEFYSSVGNSYAFLPPFSTYASAGSSTSNQTYMGTATLTSTQTIAATANAGVTSGNTVGATIALKY